jgi:hypothetical protein
MQEIGSGAVYRIAIDQTKNRLYFWLFGDITSPSHADGMVEAVKTACNTLRPNFTVLVDFTEMKLLGLPDIVQKLQNMLMEAGLKKLASVWSGETFAKLVVDSSAHKAGGGAYDQKRQVFQNRAEAEVWLDT